MQNQSFNRLTLRSIITGLILGLLIVGSAYSYLYWHNQQLQIQNDLMFNQYQQANPDMTISHQNGIITISPNLSQVGK